MAKKTHPSRCFSRSMLASCLSAVAQTFRGAGAVTPGLSSFTVVVENHT